MIYFKFNIRIGFFKEVFNNFLKDIELYKNDYVVVVIKVGFFLIYVYIYNKFMKYVVILGLLFEMVFF